MIARVRNKIKSMVDRYKHENQLKSFLTEKNGIYNFSSKDLELYLVEKKTKMQNKESFQITESLKKVTVSNHVIFWPTNVSDEDLPWLYHEIFDPFNINPSSYDHPAMKYEKSDWIIDAGCCEGYFSLFSFDKNPKCSLIALEPLAEMKESLDKTFEIQKNKNKFYLEEKALGKECGVVQFQFNCEHLCDSSMTIDDTIIESQKNSCYGVPVINLDALMLKYLLKENGIIKMDIEGAEMDALEGGVELMNKYKPRLAIAVYHDYENALKCKEIILKANPQYKVEFRGMYGYFNPPRPYMLFAW